MLPVGSPATGDDFVDRERETAFILSTIKNDHVMLVAPRRFGKTSIMRKIERDLASRGQSCVFLEVESVNSPGEFITDLVTALVECEGASPGARISSALGKAFALVQEKIDEIETPGFRAKLRSRLRAEFSDDWHEKAKKVDEIFRQSTGSESEDAFRALLTRLNHNFYVTSETPGELRFCSKMLRDWWRIYHAGAW